MTTKKEVVEEIISSIRSMSNIEYNQLYDSIADKEEVFAVTQGYDIALSFGLFSGTATFDYKKISREHIEIESELELISMNLKIPLAA